MLFFPFSVITGNNKNVKIFDSLIPFFCQHVGGIAFCRDSSSIST